MKIRMRDGRVLRGTARQIVQQMQDIAMGAPAMSLSDYIDWVAQRASEYEGVALPVTGDTEDARSGSLIEQMVAHGLAERLS